MILQFKPMSQVNKPTEIGKNGGTVHQFRPREKSVQEPTESEVTPGYYDCFGLTQEDVEAYQEDVEIYAAQAAAYMLEVATTRCQAKHDSKPSNVEAQCTRCASTYIYTKGTNAPCPFCGSRGKRSITVVAEEK